MENEKIRKDETRGRIILFAIGVLVGAVIASAAFLICVNTLGFGNNANTSMQMPSGMPPERPSGDSEQDEQEQPPEVLNGKEQNEEG